MKLPTLIRLLAVVAFLGSSAMASANPEFYYHYRGSKRALDVDADHIAVKLASPGAADEKPSDTSAKSFAARATGLGYKAEDAQGFRPNGWIKLGTKGAAAKLNLPPQASQKDKHKKLLDDVAQIGGVEFVSPIFLDAKHNPVIFEPTLLIGFVDGVSETEQDGIVKKIKNVKSVGRHGLKNKWTLTTGFRHGIDLLDAANEVAGLPGVRYAEPNFLLSAEAL